MLRKTVSAAVSLMAALALVVVQAAGAGAVPRPQPPATGASGSNTDMTMSGTGAGQSVTGFIANPTNPFDPVLDGYPTTNPSTGFSPKDEGFAGIILGQPSDGSPPCTCTASTS